MSSTPRSDHSIAPSLRPSRFDRIASLLISMLILTGTSVATLGILWLGTQREMVKIAPPVGDGTGLRDIRAIESTEFDTPDLAELSQVAVTEPMTELSKLLSHESIAAASTLDINKLGSSVDPRPAGPPNPPDDVPRWERWEIRYEASSLKSYAKQLDFFGIELGAAGGKKHVDYASNFTKATPVSRSGEGSDETRLYMTWRGGKLKNMDGELLQRAGVDVDRRIIMQFYPKKIEDMLARIESEHTKDGRVDKLRKTIFGVRPADGGYEFFIIEQR